MFGAFVTVDGDFPGEVSWGEIWEEMGWKESRTEGPSRPGRKQFSENIDLRTLDSKRRGL